MGIILNDGMKKGVLSVKRRSDRTVWVRLTPCIHRNILISVLFISISSFFFIVQHSAPLCHSRCYNSLIYFMFERDGYFLATYDSSYFSPLVPG